LKEVASMKGFMLAGLALLLVGLGVGKSVAQAPNDWWEWVKIIDGGGNDEGHSVQQTSDGGFILLGWTESFDAREADVWLVKTDASGNIEWDRTFGRSDRDKGYSVQQTSDGGFILVGYTESFGAGWEDVWLIKTDADGNKLWEKTFGGSGWDGGFSVQQTSDGGFIIAGATWSFGAGEGDVWLVKTDASGNIEWDRTFGGSRSDLGFSVQQTSDGGFIIAGATWSFGAGEGDVWLIKTDADGNMLWDRTFGGRYRWWGYWDESYSVQQTSDGGYILVGSTLIRTDANGNKLWERNFSGNSVQQTRDGGFILVGGTEWFVGHAVLLIKTDADGNKLWERTFGGGLENYSVGLSVQQTSDGGYILLGSTFFLGSWGKEFLLIKSRP
jgi:hypothetical protein